MSIAFVAAAPPATYTTAGAAKQITIPATAAAGTFMLLAYAGSQTQPDSNPSGWTRVAFNQGGTCYATWWMKIAVSGDAGSVVTVTAASNAKTALTLTVFSGVDTTTPVAVSNTKPETTSSATHADPTLSLPGGYTGRIIRSLALKDASGATSTTWTPASGTVRATANVGGTSGTVSVQSGSGADVSSYTAGVWTVDQASTHAVTLALALTPATVVTPPTSGYRGAMTGGNSGQTAPATTAVLTLPGAATANDTGIIIATSDQGVATATAPTGWHRQTVQTVAADNNTSVIFSKRLTAADITAGTVTITWSTPGRCPASGVVMFGLDATTPLGQPGYVAGTTATKAAPSVTSLFDTSQILTLTSSRTANGAAPVPTYPTGWTRRTNVASNFASGSGAARFAPVRIAGGGTIQVLDKHPTTGVIVAGSDTQGYYRSADNGDHWTVVNRGLGPGGTKWHGCAAIVWSQTEANTVYAACGGSGGSGGGWLAGRDNGTEVVWEGRLRSTAVSFSGNRSNPPLPTRDPRSSGYLIAQDGTYIYAATYNDGVARSSDNGRTWTFCQMAGVAPGSGNYFARSLAQDPSDPTILYVAMYGYDGTHGHVWKCTNAHSTTPNFTKLTASPNIVEELRFVGTTLYAAAGGDGIYKTTDGGTTWTALNGTFVNTSSSIWSGLDGYVDGSGAHVLIASDDNPTADHAACLIRLTIPQPSGSITYAKLTGSVNYRIPPENRTWWNAGGNLILGQGSWANGFVYVDDTVLPTVDVYIAGRSGTYRSLGSLGETGYRVANNGEPCFLGRGLGCDPNDANHLIFTSTDWNAFEITDGVGYDASTGFRQNLPFAGQGYGVDFDPVDSTAYVGGSNTKGVNGAGSLYYRPPGAARTTWTSASWPVPASIPAGVCGLRDASNAKIVVVASWGGGIWRGKWNAGSYSWAGTGLGQRNATACAGDTLVALYEFPVMNVPGSKYVYVWDYNTGVWRSDDYGATWVKVWAATSNDPYAASMALNPTVPGEVWVTSNSGLYKLSGVHNAVVGSGATATKNSTVTGTPGLVAFSTNGSILYCTTQDTGNGSGMLYSTNGGSTWADAVGDGSLAGPAYQSSKIAVAADDRVYLSGSNEVVMGYPVPISAGTAGAANMSCSIATLDTPGAKGTYGGETVSFSPTPSSEQVYTVACQTGTSATAPHLLYQVSNGALVQVTLAKVEGTSVVPL